MGGGMEILSLFYLPTASTYQLRLLGRIWYANNENEDAVLCNHDVTS